jgi:hypothetical protein
MTQTRGECVTHEPSAACVRGRSTEGRVRRRGAGTGEMYMSEAARRRDGGDVHGEE